MKNRIPPPLLFLALAIAMWFASGGVAAPWRVGSALAVFVVAGAIGLPAIAAFRRSGTTLDPLRIERASSLVQSGIYRFTPNPMYLSLTLMLVAWAIALDGLLPWLGPLLLGLWLDRFQIRPEEEAMAARFGESYRQYCFQVRRWL